MICSHHSHSGQFCLHAKDMLEEMVQRAIRVGMSTFALTEHLPRDSEDFYPEEIKYGMTTDEALESFDQYYHEAMRLKEIYKEQIELLVGFESEWIRESSARMVHFVIGNYKFDLFIGSIHHVHTIPIDVDREHYVKARSMSGGTDGHLFAQYFDDQYSMLHNLKPPVVGHFDLIRLWCHNPDLCLKNMTIVWEKIQRNLRFIADYGGLLEINSAAIRKGLRDPYPCREICEEYVMLKGRFTLSDDSHSVEHVGANYKVSLEAGLAAGVEKLHILGYSHKTLDERFPNIAISKVESTQTLLMAVREAEVQVVPLE